MIEGQKTLILGAGPAGLTAAYFLVKAGVSVVVLEAADQIGGLCRTYEKDGYRFDLGGHRWYSESDFANNFFKTICGDSLLEVPRTTRIYFQNHFYNLPIQPLEILKNIGVRKATAVVFDYLTQKKVVHPGELNLEEAYTNQFGKTLYELFFKRYNEKLWGRSCTELSGKWIGLRAKGLTLGSTLKGLISKNKDSESIDTFLYPKLGISQFCENLAAEIRNSGLGEIRTSSKVESVVTFENKVVSIIATDGKYEPEYVVSSLPINYCSQLLGTYQPKIGFRDLVVVTLFLNREQVTTDSWVYTQEPILCFTRFHEPKNWSKEMCPSGKTSLVCEYSCQEGDSIWMSSDQNLIDSAARDLSEKAHLIKFHEVIGGAVVRVKNAYPIYTLGYEEEVKKALVDLNRFSNMRVIGRQGQFYYGSLDQPILSGKESAEEVIKEIKEKN